MTWRTYQALLVVAALMAGFLLALPVWDWWTYRQAEVVTPSPEYRAPAGTDPPTAVAAIALPARGDGILAAGMAPPPAPAPSGRAALHVQPAQHVQPVQHSSNAAVAAPAQVPRGAGREVPPPAATSRTDGPDPTRLPSRSESAAPVRPPAAQPASPTAGSGSTPGAPPPPSTTGPLSWVRSLFVQAPAAAPATETPPQPADSPAPRPEEDTSDPSPDSDRPPEAGAPRLSLVPNAPEVAYGKVLTVRVVLTGGEKVTSVPFHLKFDPALLEFLGARTGPAFVSSSLEPLLLASVNPERPGDLAVGLALIGTSRSFTGSGSLVVLDFRAVGRGRSDLTFENSSVRGATSEALPVEFANTSIQVD